VRAGAICKNPSRREERNSPVTFAILIRRGIDQLMAQIMLHCSRDQAGHSTGRRMAMRACVSVGLVLCALCVPLANASVRDAVRFGEQRAAMQSPLGESVLEQSNAIATLEWAPDRVFEAGAAGASIISAAQGCDDGLRCIAMSEKTGAALAHRIVRLATRGATAAEHASHTEAMTALDLVLMVLFAVGLIGYQLDRKQRVLRHSALFAAPP
jgi:hypothetical protein